MVCLQKKKTHKTPTMYSSQVQPLCKSVLWNSMGYFFFWFTVHLYVAAQECEYNEALLHLGSCYTMLLNNLPFVPPFICCSQIVLVLFSFNWELIFIWPLEMIKKPTSKPVFPQPSVLSLNLLFFFSTQLLLFFALLAKEQQRQNIFKNQDKKTYKILSCILMFICRFASVLQ